jgi:hypothetical protein
LAAARWLEVGTVTSTSSMPVKSTNTTGAQVLS